MIILFKILREFQEAAIREKNFCSVGTNSYR